MELLPGHSETMHNRRNFLPESPPLLPTSAFVANDLSLLIGPQTPTVLVSVANPLETPAPSTPSTSSGIYRFGVPIGWFRGLNSSSIEKFSAYPKPPEAKRIRHATDTFQQQEITRREPFYYRSASNPESALISTVQERISMASSTQQTEELEIDSWNKSLQDRGVTKSSSSCTCIQDPPNIRHIRQYSPIFSTSSITCSTSSITSIHHKNEERMKHEEENKNRMSCMYFYLKTLPC